MNRQTYITRTPTGQLKLSQHAIADNYVAGPYATPADAAGELSRRVADGLIRRDGRACAALIAGLVAAMVVLA